MQETDIEWVRNPDSSQGYTWNPITGCLNHDNGLCKGGGFPCYACKLANTRLKNGYISYHGDKSPLIANYNELPLDKAKQTEADPFYPRFWEERLEELKRGYHYTDWSGACAFGAAAKGIFVCDMSDLFGIGVPTEWTRQVLRSIQDDPYDRFYILTKQAQRLPDFSPFPENAWVGVTATNPSALRNAVFYLDKVKATVKYISMEPLLADMKGTDRDEPKWSEVAYDLSLGIVDWLIIGACTGTFNELMSLHSELELMPFGKKWTLQPKIEWLRGIVEAADRAGIRVFLKDNLSPLLRGYPIPKANMWAYKFVEGHLELRQELPK